ncbi:MAG: hypothetical protein AAFY71_00170 [Bacteroidota bacterium]
MKQVGHIYKIGLAISCAFLLFSCTDFYNGSKIDQGGEAQEKLSSSLLQLRTSSKNIVPIVSFFVPQQDTSTDFTRKLDPITDNTQDEDSDQGEPLQDANTPTWIKMIGALVDVFLSVYKGI